MKDTGGISSGDISRGLLLSFEGIDASGKNTQSTMLFDYLKQNGVRAEYLSFPVYSTTLGREIESFLLGKKEYGIEARHLLYAANRYEFKDRIEKWLDEGRVVIANRYCESNLAYGVANGLPLEWLKSVESLMPRADFVFLLKATSSLSSLRKTERDKYEANLDFLNRVSEVYDALIEQGRWFTIDADGAVESIHYEISTLALSLLTATNKRQGTNIASGRVF